MTKHLIVFLATILIFSNCSQQKYISAKWHTNEYSYGNVIDLGYLYHSDSRIFYSITNNNENLYVNLRINEPNVQKQLFVNGLTVWLDTTARNKKELGVTFPQAKKDRLHPPAFHVDYIDKKRAVNSFDTQWLDIELLGFEESGSTSLIPGTNNLGFKGDIELIEDGVMQYQLIIPLEQIWSTMPCNDKFLSINLISEGAVSNTTSMPMTEKGASMRGGGKGSGQRGGGQRGMQAGMTPNKMAMVVPIKIKIKKIKLLNSE